MGMENSGEGGEGKKNGGSYAYSGSQLEFSGTILNAEVDNTTAKVILGPTALRLMDPQVRGSAPSPHVPRHPITRTASVRPWLPFRGMCALFAC